MGDKYTTKTSFGEGLVERVADSISNECLVKRTARVVDVECGVGFWRWYVIETLKKLRAFEPEASNHFRIFTAAEEQLRIAAERLSKEKSVHSQWKSMKER